MEELNKPIGVTVLDLNDFGRVKGFKFENDISQFMGIPYGYLEKRWTRAKILSKLPNGYHDGTKLGHCMPSPEKSKDGDENGDILTPVDQLPHFASKFKYDEKSALILNIVCPKIVSNQKLPVMVYIHGGSLMYGSSNLAIFDCVHLVKKSIKENMPVLGITLNYRIGIGGFLASKHIKEDLAIDGFTGNGNFGFTDQLLALEWISKNIGLFGGDKENITILGESAGGVSVGQHVFSNQNPKIKRAICMSGTAGTIPGFPEEWHEQFYRRILNHFNIEYGENSLCELRKVREDDLAKATAELQGSQSATSGNPCIDYWYLDREMGITDKRTPPNWLEGLMIGDTKDEGIIFKGFYEDFTYNDIIEYFSVYIEKEKADKIFSLYGLNEDTKYELIPEIMVAIMGDFAFLIPNYQCTFGDLNSPPVYYYHFDEKSTLDNALYGKSYHAIDLLYLFGNRRDFNESQKNLRNDYMIAYLKFANGIEPWEQINKKQKVMIFGPVDQGLSCGHLVSISEDDSIRNYTRMNKILALPVQIVENFFLGLDSLTNRRKSLLQ